MICWWKEGTTKRQIHLRNPFLVDSESHFRVICLLSITCAKASLTTRFLCDVHLSVAYFRFILTGFCRVNTQWVWSSDSLHCTEVLIVLQTSYLLQRREWNSSLQYYSCSHLAFSTITTSVMEIMHSWMEKRSDLLRWLFSRHCCIHNGRLCFGLFIPRRKSHL